MVGRHFDQFQEKIEMKFIKHNMVPFICIIVIMIVSLGGCCEEKEVDGKVANGIFVDELLGVSVNDTVTKINISTQPQSQGILKKVEIVESENIKALVDYFNYISIFETKKIKISIEVCVILFCLKLLETKLSMLILVGICL